MKFMLHIQATLHTLVAQCTEGPVIIHVSDVLGFILYSIRLFLLYRCTVFVLLDIVEEDYISIGFRRCRSDSLERAWGKPIIRIDLVDIITCNMLKSCLSSSRQSAVLLIHDHNPIPQCGKLIVDHIVQDLDRIVLRAIIDKDELDMRICLAEHRSGKLSYILLYTVNRHDQRNHDIFIHRYYFSNLDF